MTAAELAEKLGAWADLLEVNSDTRWTPDACVWIRQAAARLRSMEEALKEAHEAINLAMTIAQGRFPATARKAPLEVLADAERKARAALAGVANGQV